MPLRQTHKGAFPWPCGAVVGEAGGHTAGRRWLLLCLTKHLHLSSDHLNRSGVGKVSGTEELPRQLGVGLGHSRRLVRTAECACDVVGVKVIGLLTPVVVVGVAGEVVGLLPSVVCVGGGQTPPHTVVCAARPLEDTSATVNSYRRGRSTTILITRGTQLGGGVGRWREGRGGLGTAAPPTTLPSPPPLPPPVGGGAGDTLGVCRGCGGSGPSWRSWRRWRRHRPPASP